MTLRGHNVKLQVVFISYFAIKSVCIGDKFYKNRTQKNTEQIQVTFDPKGQSL